MCGIAGFSMSPGSEVNTKALTHHLFREIEARGTMSSGFAYLNADGNVGMFKEAITATQLNLDEMPRNARHGILHTRYATKGSPKVNANNHPVVSPEANIALVHNGVIYNDSSIRRGALKGVEMAEVDTAVIPALIEAKGVAGLTELAGDAAIAWIDQRDAEVLHVARVEGSPLYMTYLTDGSMVFASTEILLTRALDSAKLEHSEIFGVSELTYGKFTDGALVEQVKLDPIQHFSWADYSWRAQTSGGARGAAAEGTGSTRYGAAKYGRGVGGNASVSYASETPDSSFWDDEDWTDDPESIDPNPPFVLDTTTGEIKDYEDDRDPSLTAYFYYSMSHWGDSISYVDENKMLTEFAKISKRFATDSTELLMFPDVDESLRFLENVADIGIIDTEGDEVSFVEKPEAMDDFEVPSLVRDAVEALRKIGAQYA